MNQSFWEKAANSLPPHLRRRYAADFEMAERFDEALDAGIHAWGVARRALGAALEVFARNLHSVARRIGFAARRLSGTH